MNTDFQSFLTFPSRLTVIAWRSVFVLRSISALGTPRKVFLSLFRVTTPKDGLVLTIFVSRSRHSRFVQLHFSIISLQRNKLWTTRCVDRMLHFRSAFNVHSQIQICSVLLLAIRSMKIFHSSRRSTMINVST